MRDTMMAKKPTSWQLASTLTWQVVFRLTATRKMILTTFNGSITHALEFIETVCHDGCCLWSYQYYGLNSNTSNRPAHLLFVSGGPKEHYPIFVPSNSCINSVTSKFHVRKSNFAVHTTRFISLRYNTHRSYSQDRDVHTKTLS